jgi:dihydroflavonol-4-reductase
VHALVTGASGFVGSHVARRLAEAGADVRSFSRTPPPEWARVAEHVAGDVCDPAALRRAADGCELVVHAAALYSYDRRDHAAMERVNVDGTRHVLDAAARAGARRVVVTSSATTCGPVRGRAADEDDEPPREQLAVAYKRTKIAGERVALDAAREGHDAVVVNPTAVVGPGDRRPTPTGRMIADVVAGRIRAYTPGMGLNVVAVEDVAAGHLLAAEHGRSGRRYILGGEDLPLREVFAIVARAAGRTPPRWAVPYPVVVAAARIAAAAGLSPRLLVLDQVRLAGIPEYYSSARAESELGYRARPAEDALAAAVRSRVA